MTNLYRVAQLDHEIRGTENIVSSQVFAYILVLSSYQYCTLKTNWCNLTSSVDKHCQWWRKCSYLFLLNLVPA